MTKVEITLKGRPGHGSIPTAADNALVRAAEVVTRVHAYEAPTVITPGELYICMFHSCHRSLCLFRKREFFLPGVMLSFSLAPLWSKNERDRLL